MTIRFARMLENAPLNARQEKRQYEMIWTNEPDALPFIAEPLQYTVIATVNNNGLVIQVVATDIHGTRWDWCERWREVQP